MQHSHVSHDHLAWLNPVKQTNEQQQQQKNKTAKDKSGRLKLFICQIKACQVVFTGTPEQDFTKAFPLYNQF